MQPQEDSTDEIIDEIIKHWDGDNWPPRKGGRDRYDEDMSTMWKKL